MASHIISFINVIIYSYAQIVPDLANGSPFKQNPMGFLFFEHFPISWHNNMFQIILDILCLSFEISHFSKVPSSGGYYVEMKSES